MAGAGAGAMAVDPSEISDDPGVLAEMREFFAMVYDNLALRESLDKGWSFTLGMKAINGKTYRTTFTVQIKNTLTTIPRIKITNGCISISVFPTIGKPEEANLSSEIRANTRTPACFEPRLTTNKSSVPRITTTDVLQVLKLKLMLAQPITDPNDIELYDMATIKSTRMTPFRLLRGLPPFYEKYGYFNKVIPRIQKQLSVLTLGKVRDALGRDVTAEERVYVARRMVNNNVADEDVPLLLKVKFAEMFEGISDSTLLIAAINTKIGTLEEEEAVYPKFSFDVLEFLFSSKLVKKLADMSEFEFKFRPDSPEWNHWKHQIVVTSFELSPVERSVLSQNAGSRKKRSSSRLSHKSHKTKKAGRRQFPQI
jgi:hypothetical protein